MNAANAITLVRIALVPVFMAIWYIAPWPAAFTVFLIASITDKLDGYVARKYNLTSTFGKFIDPLADKLLICAALLVLLENGEVAAWAAAIILIREFIVTSLRTVAMGEGKVIAASNTGKVKMVIQVVAICVVLVPPVSHIALGGVTVGDIFVWLMTAVTLWSGIEYCYVNRDVFKAAKK